MGLYEPGFEFHFPFVEKKNILTISAIILVLILIGGFLFWVLGNLEQSPFNFRFDKNPIMPGEQTKVVVTLTNISEFDAADVPLTLEVRERTEFDIYPLNEKFTGEINILAKGNSREITFLINPIGEVLPGTYTLEAKTNINGVEYAKIVTLRVES